MATLKLSLLGPFIASYNNQPLQNLRTNKVQALLIYLAVGKDRAHPRESLMELLWPGMPLESAQVNLRQTIYRLRKAIPEVSSISSDERVPLVLSDRQSVQLNPEAAIDLDVFCRFGPS
jgi:DNA-binding SARP family transcriptional activator